MMQLLRYITLQFDGQEIPYKLYFNPSDQKYHFKPEAVITLYPSFVLWRLDGVWGHEPGLSQTILKQLTVYLNEVRKQHEEPLL